MFLRMNLVIPKYPNQARFLLREPELEINYSMEHIGFMVGEIRSSSVFYRNYHIVSHSQRVG